MPETVPFLRDINIIVDRRHTKKAIREDFDDYIKLKIEGRALFRPRITISHYNSQNSAGLQAVDFIS
ncbi:MAG: DUF3800 domain-containing protein [Thermodesulfobacteriota bacterium]